MQTKKYNDQQKVDFLKENRKLIDFYMSVEPNINVPISIVKWLSPIDEQEEEQAYQNLIALFSERTQASKLSTQTLETTRIASDGSKQEEEFVLLSLLQNIQIIYRSIFKYHLWDLDSLLERLNNLMIPKENLEKAPQKVYCLLEKQGIS